MRPGLLPWWLAPLRVLRAAGIGAVAIALGRVVVHFIASAPLRPTLRGVAAAMAAAVLSVVTLAVAAGQTLTEPNPQATWSLPHPAANAAPPRRLKSCSIYGAGFVNVPGTDACVKVGGYVGAEVTTGR